MEQGEKYFVAKISSDLLDTESGKVKKMREEQDPIEYIKNKLLTKKILNEDDLSKIDSNIRLEISELAEKATKAEVPKEEELYNNVLSS